MTTLADAQFRPAPLQIICGMDGDFRLAFEGQAYFALIPDDDQPDMHARTHGRFGAQMMAATGHLALVMLEEVLS